MLGFSAISARPISGGSFGLVAVAAAMSATGAIEFSGSAQWGIFQSLAARGTLTFSGSGVWSSLNAMSASSGLTFSGSPQLRLAGRPFVFYALPERLIFNAQGERLMFTAKPDNFTFRGMR